jgi:hypothetical protein
MKSDNKISQSHAGLVRAHDLLAQEQDQSRFQ